MIMATTMWKIEKSRGYQACGRTAQKSWIAEIDGTDGTYGLSRSFREADEIDWGDSKMYKRNKGVWHEIHRVGPGLYEVCQHGDRSYRIVWLAGDAAKWCVVDETRAKAIAALLDDGQEYETARQATKPAPKTEVQHVAAQ